MTDMTGYTWVRNVRKTETPGVYGYEADGLYRFKNGHEGPPKSSDTYSSEKISEWGYVGIYQRDGEPAPEVEYVVASELPRRCQPLGVFALG
jgi:hypothetical protein